MKKIFTFLILIFITIAPIKAQEYFNHRYLFDENFNIGDISSVVATDTAYYATLAAIDTSVLNHIGSVFVKFDLEGNVQRMTYHIDSTSALQTWSPVLKINQDGDFITCGKYLVYDEEAINRAILIKMNEAGEFIQTKEYYSPHIAFNDFLVPIKMDLCADGGYVIINNIASLDGNHTDIWITRFDADFNLLWDNAVIHSWHTSGKSIKEDAQGNFIIGAWTHDYTMQHRYNINSHSYLIKLDHEGNLLWEYFTPEGEVWGPAYDIINTEDGGIVIAGFEGEELTVAIGAEGDSIGYLLFEHVMFKLDSDLEIEWKTSFIADKRYVIDGTKYAKMVKASDGSGYVAGGTAFFLKSNEDDVHERGGWLTKVSEEGDSLWARHLYYLDTLVFSSFIMDVNNATDGGYVLSGNTFKKTDWGNEPQQQGWLLKVDEYGCLVPGCDGTVDAEETPEALPFRLLLYPNPVQQDLYVHFQTKDFTRDNRFRIVAYDGRVMQDFSSPSAEGTFIANVGHYPSGMYVLEYFEEGVLLGAESFVKE